MALRSGTLLLILGLLVGSLAVAHAGRGLLDDKKDNDKCYPSKYQKECPKADAKYCFYDDGYGKMKKKKCFADYSKVVKISYTDKQGYSQCYDGKSYFYPKCDSIVKLYTVDSQYCNKDGKKMKKDDCISKDYGYDYCGICDYKFKVKCEKKEKPKEDKPKYNDDKKEEDKKYRSLLSSYDDDKKKQEEEYKQKYNKEEKNKNEYEEEKKKEEEYKQKYNKEEKYNKNKNEEEKKKQEEEYKQKYNKEEKYNKNKNEEEKKKEEKEYKPKYNKEEKYNKNKYEEEKKKEEEKHNKNKDNGYKY